MINQEYDTFRQRMYDRAYKKRLPLYALFELTYRCNFRCIHCYNSQKQKEMKPQDELKTKEIFDILTQLKDLGCLFLGFTGGEIFLREDILEILFYARKLGFEVKLLTNASLIDEDTARDLSQLRLNRVEITVHALKRDIFDKITGISGSGDKVFKAIEILHKRNVPLGFKTSGMIVNKSEISKINRFAKKLGAIYRFSGELVPRYDGSKIPLQYCLSHRKKYQLYRECHPEMFIPKKIKPETKTKIKRRSLNKVFNCGAGFINLIINPCGELKICAEIDEPKYNILGSCIAECWQRLKDFIDNLKPPKDWCCRRCDLVNYCFWCPAQGYLEKGDFFACVSSIREQAEFTKQLISKNYSGIIF